MSDWEGVAVLCRGTEGRSLLMVLQGHPDEEPTWAVPGGSIEPGETPEQAAIREMKEEAGLDVRIMSLYAVVDGTRDYGTYRVYYYHADVVGGEARTRDPDALIHAVAWVPAERIPGLSLSHEDQRWILLTFMGVL